MGLSDQSAAGSGRSAVPCCGLLCAHVSRAHSGGPAHDPEAPSGMK